VQGVGAQAFAKALIFKVIFDLLAVERNDSSITGDVNFGGIII